MQPIEIRHEAFRIDEHAQVRIMRSLKAARTWTMVTAFFGLVVVLLTLFQVAVNILLIKASAPIDAELFELATYINVLTVVITLLVYGLPSVILLSYSQRVDKVLQSQGFHEFPQSMMILRRFWMATAIISVIMICLAIALFGWGFMTSMGKL